MGNEFAIARSILNGAIWIPPNGRPFWTAHNSAGNAGPHLTDEELDEHKLSGYKVFSFSQPWFMAHVLVKMRQQIKWQKNSISKT